VKPQVEVFLLVRQLGDGEGGGGYEGFRFVGL